MRVWPLVALACAALLAATLALIAVADLINPARAVCAKTTDKELIPMCRELDAG